MFIQVKKKTLPEAHMAALTELCESGTIVDAPDWNTKRIEISLVQTVLEPLTDPMISLMVPCDAGALEAYIAEICEGTMDYHVPKKLSYTYHDRMVIPYDQFDYAVQELIRNPTSTRACIVIRYPKDILLKDQPCLSFIQYMLRNDQLDTIVTFRSNDAMKASAMNDIALVKLSERIVIRLRQAGISVHVGSYTKIANSYHAYERDWPALTQYTQFMAERERTFAENYDTFMSEYRLEKMINEKKCE